MSTVNTGRSIDMAENSTKIRTRVQDAIGFTTHAASGVWGGATPNGMVLCSFYVERQALPELIESTMFPTGDIVPQRAVFTDGTSPEDGTLLSVRENQTAILLQASDAYFIGKWMIEKALSVGFRPPDKEAEAAE